MDIINIENISMMGTYFFSILTAIGLVSQIVKILNKESAKSVSVIWNTEYLAHHLVVLSYGLAQARAPIIFNGLLISVVYIPLVFLIWKSKQITKIEKIATFFFVGFVVASFASKENGWAFFSFQIISAFAILLQGWEIVKNEDAGSVDIKYILILATSILFWTGYAYSTDEKLLKVICPILLGSLSATTVAWFVYRNPRKGDGDG